MFSSHTYLSMHVPGFFELWIMVVPKPVNHTICNEYDKYVNVETLKLQKSKFASEGFCPKDIHEVNPNDVLMINEGQSFVVLDDEYYNKILTGTIIL